MARLRRPRDGENDFFPGFTDIAEIGAGSLAVVYRARELSTGRLLALKLLTPPEPSPQAFDYLERQAAALVGVSSHPNIVSVFGTFRAPDGRPVEVLELCAGSVGARVVNGQSIPAADVVALGIKIATALETAHRAGFVHGDITPQNILITEYGEPALADFGLAMAQPGVRGTAGSDDAPPLHSAPELLDGAAVSPASDVYELASSLYQLVVGHAAFRAYDGESPASIIRRVLRDPVPPLGATAPAALSGVLLTALSKSPADRPTTAAELAAQLAAVAAGSGWPRTPFLIRDPDGRTADLPPITRMPSAPAHDWSAPTTAGAAAGAAAPAAGELWTAPPPDRGEPLDGETTTMPPIESPETGGTFWTAPSPPAAAAVTVAADDGWGEPMLIEHQERPETPTPAPPVPPPPAAPPPAPVEDDWSTPRVVTAEPQPVVQPEPAAESSPVTESSPLDWATEPGAAAEPVATDRPVPMAEDLFVPPPTAVAATIGEALSAPAEPAPAPELPATPEPVIEPAPAPPAETPAPEPPAPEPPADAAVDPIFSAPPVAEAEPVVELPPAQEPPPAPVPLDVTVDPMLIDPSGTSSVPTWAFSAPSQTGLVQLPQGGFGPPGPIAPGRADAELSLDPATLSRTLTIRARMQSITVDERELALRAWGRRTSLPWPSIYGFEVRTEGQDSREGHLVAVTASGPVDLPATRKPVAELRYLHALLEAYRQRAQMSIGG